MPSPEDLHSIIKEIKKDHFLFTKRAWYAFFGAALATFAAAGILTWSAVN